MQRLFIFATLLFPQFSSLHGLFDHPLVLAMAEQQQLEPWADLSGKVVMVTGASSGLGREFCLDLAQAGCRIVAAARRVDRLMSLCDEINRLILPSSKPQPSGPRAVAVELDVCADGATIQRNVKMAWDAFGRIDALINNAGVRGKVKDALKLSEEEWNQNLKTNLTGSWLVSKYVCMHMRDANQGGSIINISSIAGLNRGQLPGGVAYASAKVGLNTMTKEHACWSPLMRKPCSHGRSWLDKRESGQLW